MHYRLIRVFFLIPALSLVPVVLAQTAGTPVTEAQVRARLLRNSYIEGQVTDLKLTGKEGQITVRYIHTIQRNPNPFAVRKAEILKKIYEKVVESKFQPAIDKVGAKLDKAMKEASSVEEVPVLFTLRITPDTRLRTMAQPLDDNGKPRKLTTEEYRKLKGNLRLPGFTATVDNFDEYQQVRFYVDKIRFRPTKVKSGQGDKVIYPVSTVIIMAPPKITDRDNPFLSRPKK